MKSLPTSSPALARHEARLRKLEAQVKRLLAEVHGAPELPKKGKYEKWLESTDAEPYAGLHIAWLPTKGVVAARDRIGDLLREVQDHKQREKLVIGFVSSGGI